LVELDAAYCDVIVQRWEEFSGGTAIQDDNGRAFDDIAVVRKNAAPCASTV
jgi:hypothetical protein